MGINTGSLMGLLSTMDRSLGRGIKCKFKPSPLRITMD